MSTQVTLTGRQKAAYFCIQVGAEQSAKILKHLREDEVELLTVEIAQAQRTPPEVTEAVLQEFVELSLADNYLRAGGIEYARELLERALGKDRAREILQRLTSNLRKRPFDSLSSVDPGQLAGLLQHEHPQTTAVVLAHLHPQLAASVMNSLPPERQADIVRRVSALDRASPDMLREAERVILRKLSGLVAHEMAAPAGGLDWAVSVLHTVDRSTERKILEDLQVVSPELASDIAQRMFLFEDMVKLDDRTIQRILRGVDVNRDLPLALKPAKPELWRKITSNVSVRVADTLREATEYMGRVRIRDVEEAQARIVEIIRTLEAKGEIQIARGGGEDEYI